MQKRKRKWSLVFADAERSKDPRTVGIPGALILICMLAIAAGLVGFGRIAYFGAGYALAVYDATERQRENNRLKEQIENLEKFVKQKNESIAKLIGYEDNARLKYGLEAISADVRQAGVGGFPSRDDIRYSSIEDPMMLKADSLRTLVSSLNRQAELQESTFAQVSRHAQKIHSGLARRPSIWPANGRVTSTYGYRYHPFSGMRLMHEGIDIANSYWTPIYATADGQVRDNTVSSGFGNLVKIAHGSNGEYVTYYAHLQKSAVTQGQIIKRGDVVGYMGSSGRSTGSHLHYEIHHNGRPIDPMKFIVPVDQIVD